MWDYLFLISYIKNKQNTDLNGVEEEIFRKIK